LLPPLLVSRLKSSAWKPLVLNILLSFIPGIDLLAHFGGGLFGFALTISFLGHGLVPMDERRPGESIETTRRPWLNVLVVIIALAMALSIGMGMVMARR
jgi:rhomboid protease GluP